jgi:hypothetical protein
MQRFDLFLIDIDYIKSNFKIYIDKKNNMLLGWVW